MSNRKKEKRGQGISVGKTYVGGGGDDILERRNEFQPQQLKNLRVIYNFKEVGRKNMRTRGLVGRALANGLGDLGSIPGRIIPKTLKMVLDTFLLNTQQYKVCIKGKVGQSRERSSTLPYTSV